MAIRIAREGPRLMNKSALKLNQLAREWIENVEWVSVMDNGISIVPDYPNCQKLSTLLLQRNPLSQNIPDSFFMQMPRLKVLDLSKTGIKSLPESVSTLCSLRALLLSFSELKEIPSLTMLKDLRVLDLSHSRLKKLPSDIGELTNLRRLDLSYTEKLKTFPYHVLQKLSCLENFSMFRSKWRWSSVSGVGFDQISSLTSLGLSFEDRTSFIEYVRSKQWQDLQSYHLGIGQLSIFLPISKGMRSIEIQDYDLFRQDAVIELPNNIQQLALHSCHDITFLSKPSDTTDLENLRQCYLSNCSGMEFITTCGNRFPSLELLVLRKLPILKAICNGIASSQIFTKLKSLKIHSCNSMKYLFSSGMLEDFQNLEEIEVWNSSLIQEMVEDNSGLFSTVSLPKLRRLSLSSLPEMKCITKGVLICDSLETVEIWDCEKLRALPFSVSHLPSTLERIKGNRSWWDGLEWDEPNCKNLLQPFFDQGT
ncbi:putative leucine-rich repeat domain superfamily [Helianthus annuus]|nr:putative leucine-rich repeat domain superfamily [Helianthus annuus]KAJ0509423.1 putative leucine-rich repeat domain superfamily [Helianthus annuus]KAJ0517498.1 putative leucine-rich repeat domain superfamily [Helianthus annuus]KAJ0685508.1 putative leucine-rich repeat domain superfamily [Helianthus annuus]KAJ0689407.1 putative leucine-rich repeat domain superfamily [Helianthus annuus]